MKKSKWSIARTDEGMTNLVGKTDQKILAVWAIDCAWRVLPYFEEKFPEDRRPRQALDTLRAWIETGVFKMSVIRRALLEAHAAARDAGEDNAVRSAARACGQAVVTAHVPRHAYGSAIYAQQAVHRASGLADAQAAAKERDWQYQHLLDLRKKNYE